MKKIVLLFSKRLTFVSLMLTFSLIVLLAANPIYAKTVFQTNAGAYGFDISDEYEPLYMSGFVEVEYERNVSGDKHYTLVTQVLMKNKIDPSLNAFAYRVLTSPKQLRNWGFLGIGSYGNNYYNYDINTTIRFPVSPSLYQITDYAPFNNPSTSTSAIGVGYSPSGFDISANVNFNHSELTVKSNTSTSDRIYKTIYENRGNYQNSNYLKGETKNFGFINFRKTGAVTIRVEHEIQYIQQVGIPKQTSAGLVTFKNTY